MQLYVPHVDQMLAMSQRNEREMSQRNERLAFTKNYGLHELPWNRFTQIFTKIFIKISLTFCFFLLTQLKIIFFRKICVLESLPIGDATVRRKKDDATVKDK